MADLEKTTATEEQVNLNPTPLSNSFEDDDDLAEFGEEFEQEVAQTEEQLPANLEGFASRFPDWDLEPPQN
jgi:hypothetical protein